MMNTIPLKNTLIIGCLAFFFSVQLNAIQIISDTLLQTENGNGDSLEVTQPLHALPVECLSYEANKWTSSLSLFEYIYNENEVLKMTLQADLQDLIVNKKDPSYRDAILTMDKGGKVTDDWLIKVKPRGKFRNKVCDFPPLKLNFSDRSLENRGIATKHDKLKLVTHCLDGKAISKENVLREFLVYQLYNELTDNSFRVQLVEIKYIDLHNSMKPFKRYGFLIEDSDEVAERMNGKDCDCHGMDLARYNPKHANLTALFQYMVGNEDWHAGSLHNLKGIELADSDEVIAVPYDFDFAGFVNTNYAVPDASLGHTSVLERGFKGAFDSEAEYEQMKKYFIHKKDAIMERILDFKLLSTISRMECSEYIDEFYQILENEELTTSIVAK